MTEKEIREEEERFLRESDHQMQGMMEDLMGEEDEDLTIGSSSEKSQAPYKPFSSFFDTTINDYNNYLDVPEKNDDIQSRQRSFQQRTWTPNCSILCINIVQEIVNNKYRIPGKLIKMLFDEIQKGTKDPTIYTKFFLRYVVGSKNHRPIRDDAFYQLVYNHNNELIASTVKDARQNGMPLHEKEIAARRLAVYLHDVVDGHETWDGEIDIVTDINGNITGHYHEWTAHIHNSYVKRARHILFGYENTNEEDKGNE